MIPKFSGHSMLTAEKTCRGVFTISSPPICAIGHCRQWLEQVSIVVPGSGKGTDAGQQEPQHKTKP